jgi:hypothetical protein
LASSDAIGNGSRPPTPIILPRIYIMIAGFIMQVCGRRKTKQNEDGNKESNNKKVGSTPSKMTD